jgi:hypothetical protein
MVQTALTLVLLVGAGLLIRTMINISKAPSGYNTSRILTMSVTSIQMSGADFHRRALERVQAPAWCPACRLCVGRSAHRQQLAHACHHRRPAGSHKRE